MVAVWLTSGVARYFSHYTVLGKRECRLTHDKKEIIFYSESELDELRKVLQEESKRLKIAGYKLIQTKF